MKSLFAFFMLSTLLSMEAQAQSRGSFYDVECRERGDRIVLRFGGQEFRGQETLYLRRLIRENCYVSPRGQIRGVTLVAKSRYGRGEAELRVGDWYSRPERVAGHPEDFYYEDRATYDRIQFRPRQGYGAAQIYLRGNIKVRRVVIMLDNGRYDDVRPPRIIVHD